MAIQHKSTHHHIASSPTNAQLWFAAIKPPMYSVSISPVIVGMSAAYADSSHFDLRVFLALLFSCIAIIGWVNLTNDVFDFDTGADTNKRESIVNLCGATTFARNLILLISTFFIILSISLLLSIPSLFHSGDNVVLILMLICTFLGYVYQGPPFRFSYLGLGEPLCFTAWTLGVCMTYYAQLTSNPSTHQYILSKYPTLSSRLIYVLTDLFFDSSKSLFSAALLVAYPTALILFCSHFHQEKDDRKVDKLSPIVRLGVPRAERLLWALLIGFIILHVLLYFAGLLPLQVLGLATLSLRHLFRIGFFVSRNTKNLPVVRFAKLYVLTFHFLHGLLVSFGFYLVGRTSR